MRALSGEMQAHVEENRPNRRNGGQEQDGQKRATARSASRCRATADGTFEPKLIAKRQTTLGEGLDNRILSLYSKGMSYEDIQEHLGELYGLDISTGQLSAITDKILPVVEQWRSRPLEAVYSFVWLDAVHFKVRQDGKVISKAAYNVLAVDLQGRKDLLGIYIGDAESARFWLSVLTDLQNRGVKDLLICSIDNLTGFGDAIETALPPRPMCSSAWFTKCARLCATWSRRIRRPWRPTCDRSTSRPIWPGPSRSWKNSPKNGAVSTRWSWRAGGATGCG